MKFISIKQLFFVALISSFGAMAQAENAPGGPQVISSKTVRKATYVEDYQAITEVLNAYIEGCKQAKSSIMKPAFNEHATMYSVSAEGKLEGGAIPILFEGIDKDFRPSPDAQAAITRIEIVGNAASARIDANGMSGLSFTDFFQLLKVEGKWTVVSKIFQTHDAP
ncbi:nuclear transport factor 2 family protein [Pseudomonas sp. CCUG 57209]|nr:putative lumazine-binding protein [Pseudomonas sp. RIT357]MBA2932023.1 nuclear transport factor 2 family protein [Pseudomonas sivasensis]